MTARGFTAVPWPTGSSGTGQPVRSVRCLVSSTPARAAGPPMSRLVGIMAHARTEATADDPTGGPVQLRRPRRYRQGVYRRFLRPGWFVGHLLVLAAVLTCLRLGWWQWDRSQEATGSAQNLGYALLWPAFGAAFIYMWLRFLQLEVIKDVEEGRDAGYGDPRPDRAKVEHAARRGAGLCGAYSCLSPAQAVLALPPGVRAGRSAVCG